MYISTAGYLNLGAEESTSLVDSVIAKAQGYVGRFLAAKEKLMDMASSTLQPKVAVEAKKLLPTQLKLEGQLPAMGEVVKQLQIKDYLNKDFLVGLAQAPTAAAFFTNLVSHVEKVEDLQGGFTPEPKSAWSELLKEDILPKAVLGVTLFSLLSRVYSGVTRIKRARA